MKIFFLCSILLVAAPKLGAEVFTVLVFPGNTFSTTVGTNQVFRVINMGTTGGASPGLAQGQAVIWTFVIGAQTFQAPTATYSDSASTNSQPRYAPGNLPQQMAGPFSVGVQNATLGTGLIVTYEIISTTPSTQIANTVVIPEDSSGPVQIVLEQSTDLITWTAANPGTYGATTQKRFFRLRAVKQ